MAYLTVILASYLVGSIPNGLFIGKWLKGIDIRQFGSGNIGATNAFRVLGPIPAICVLVTDAVKGIFGVLFGQWCFSLAILSPEIGAIFGGIAAIIGHNWSLFLKFRGGRGVATALGVILTLSPIVTLIVLLIFIIVVLTTRYVSLASIVAALSAPFLMLLLKQPLGYLWLVTVAVVFIIIRHIPNIKRLLKGQELKIKAPPQNRE